VGYEKNPDMLTQSKYAARSAAYFWVENNLPTLADKGATEAQVNTITAVVNFHTDSYVARVKNFETIYNRGNLR
jgi:predicted chitinase